MNVRQSDRACYLLYLDAEIDGQKIAKYISSYGAKPGRAIDGQQYFTFKCGLNRARASIGPDQNMEKVHSWATKIRDHEDKHPLTESYWHATCPRTYKLTICAGKAYCKSPKERRPDCAQCHTTCDNVGCGSCAIESEAEAQVTPRGTGLMSKLRSFKKSLSFKSSSQASTSRNVATSQMLTVFLTPARTSSSRWFG